jgi:hypothetical protein
MQMLEFARSNRLPFTRRHPERAVDPCAAELAAELDASSLPLVRLPTARSCAHRTRRRPRSSD